MIKKGLNWRDDRSMEKWVLIYEKNKERWALKEV